MGLPDIPERRQDLQNNGDVAVCIPISQWNDVGFDAIPAGDEGDAEWELITQRIDNFEKSFDEVADFETKKRNPS